MYGIKEKEIEELMEIGYTRYEAKERLQKEKEIAILMEDRCTKKEAEKHLKMGSTIYENFEEDFEKHYKENWGDDEDFIERIRKMIETKDPMPGWGIAEYENETYYIEYAL